jgi:hypothetical protein
VERLTLALGALVVLVALAACSPAGRDDYRAWDPAFKNAPPAFQQAVTALWVSSYQEDTDGRFVRQTSWGQVPEKLVPDGHGGYTAAVPLLVQGETSDGPQPDRFATVLVQIVRVGDRFSLVPSDALPGRVVGWFDEGRRTVWFRGTSMALRAQTLWQFQGRY